jgi:hypothetical protein
MYIKLVQLTHLLFSNHPFATKLPSIISACDLVMLSLAEVGSRSAAMDDIEYDSCGANMMRSTFVSIKLSVKQHIHSLKISQLL